MSVTWDSMMHVKTPNPRLWSAQMLTPGMACILDVETTGFEGSIIEIAVLDAATGRVLLDTLVDPGPVAIEVGAQAVHGITATDLAGAPSWPEVWKLLSDAVGDRAVLAYNADFDRGRIIHDCTRNSIDPGDLASAERWQCVMHQRSAALNTRVRIALNGGHRALGDVLATRKLVQLLAAGRSDEEGRASVDEHRRRRSSSESSARRALGRWRVCARKLRELGR